MNPTSPKQEVELLMNDILPLAKRMLAEHGEFHPYGGVIRSDGSIVHVGVTTGNEDSDRRSSELLQILRQDFKRRAANNEIRAAGFVFDVRIRLPGGREKVNAIQVNLEHRSSYSAQVFFPYWMDQPGSINFGETFAQEGEHHVFPQC